MPENALQRITYPNNIVDAYRFDPEVGRLYNGGWHPEGKRNYKKAVLKIQACLMVYERPQLFHLCFQGRTNDEHKSLLQALVQKLHRKRLRCEWFSARETDGTKGEHLHVFFLVDASDTQAQSILNTFEDQFLGMEGKKRGIEIYINRPRNAMHKGRKYAELPWLGSSRMTKLEAMERLDDSLIWLTYIYKARGKPLSAKLGQVFSSSRPARATKQFHRLDDRLRSSGVMCESYC